MYAQQSGDTKLKRQHIFAAKINKFYYYYISTVPKILYNQGSKNYLSWSQVKFQSGQANIFIQGLKGK